MRCWGCSLTVSLWRGGIPVVEGRAAVRSGRRATETEVIKECESPDGLIAGNTDRSRRFIWLVVLAIVEIMRYTELSAIRLCREADERAARGSARSSVADVLARAARSSAIMPGKQALST